MKQKIIKRILALSMVGVMAFGLASCATTSSQDEPSNANQGQEAEQSSASPTQEPQEQEPTPTPSEEPIPSQDTTPMPNEDEPSEAMPSQEPPSSEPIPTQEPITTQEPTQSQEPIQTQAPTTTTTPPPTTPPTSTPIHTHNFIGGDCSTPSICDCGEIGNYGDHNWAYRHIDEVGHYESSGTHKVMFKKCVAHGFVVNGDQPNAREIWESHMVECPGTSMFWYEDVPNGEEQYVIDIQAHDEVYCVICGTIQ